MSLMGDVRAHFGNIAKDMESFKVNDEQLVLILLKDGGTVIACNGNKYNNYTCEGLLPGSYVMFFKGFPMFRRPHETKWVKNYEFMGAETTAGLSKGGAILFNLSYYASERLAMSGPSMLSNKVFKEELIEYAKKTCDWGSALKSRILNQCSLFNRAMTHFGYYSVNSDYMTVHMDKFNHRSAAEIYDEVKTFNSDGEYISIRVDADHKEREPGDSASPVSESSTPAEIAPKQLVMDFVDGGEKEHWIDDIERIVVSKCKFYTVFGNMLMVYNEGEWDREFVMNSSGMYIRASRGEESVEIVRGEYTLSKTKALEMVGI